MLTEHRFSLAQFSPGDLSRAHQSLDGSQNCTKCHEVGKEISGAKCLACHDEIKAQSESRHGYHFLNVSRKCVDCHKEHLGRGAKTVLFDENSFDHSQTGFLLIGKHSALRCSQCHTEKNIKEQTIQTTLTEFPHRTYLGLNSACSSCHTDQHKGRFKQECASCHTAVGWKMVASFDHSKTQFPLDGRHAQVTCEKCHPSITQTKENAAVGFQTKTFSDCTPCHVSPHKSSFNGTDCRSCHVPRGWEEALKRPFDHNLTSYKLVGRHTSLKCEQCHSVREKRDFARTFLIAFHRCTDCHADRHNGEFLQAYNNDCSSCHTQDRYRPSTFTLARHDQTRFELTGGHVAVNCSSCHRKGETNALQFHWSNIRCVSCHQDVHNGQFARLMENASCDRCHSTNEWKTAAFDHSTTTFELVGKHAQLPCSDCHREVKNGREWTQFTKLSTDCQSCHKDVHQSQFAQNDTTNCGLCHTPQDWRELAFDHATQSSFKLKGAHAKVPCNGCHRQETSAKVTFVRFKPLSAKCESCHQQQRNVE